MTAAVSKAVGTRMISNSPSAGVEMLANPLSGAGARAKPPSLTIFWAMEIPVKGAVTRSIIGTTPIGASPSTTQKRAISAIPMRIVHGTSSASRACALRGMARNEIPKALAKQAIASTPVSASMAAPIGSMIFIRMSGIWKLKKRLWNVSHSLTKPLLGGSAEIETAPIRKKAAVQGIFRISPPYSSMLRVCVAWSKEPAPIKRSPLNMA